MAKISLENDLLCIPLSFISRHVFQPNKDTRHNITFVMKGLQAMFRTMYFHGMRSLSFGMPFPHKRQSKVDLRSHVCALWDVHAAESRQQVER